MILETKMLLKNISQDKQTHLNNSHKSAVSAIYNGLLLCDSSTVLIMDLNVTNVLYWLISKWIHGPEKIDVNGGITVPRSAFDRLVHREMARTSRLPRRAWFCLYTTMTTALP